VTRYHDFTGLGRVLDLSNATNVIAVAGSAVAFIAFAGVSFVDDDLSIPGAAAASVAIFLAWATARELDPDTPAAATWALVLAMLLGLANVPSAIVAGTAMLAIRLVVGTVGAPVTILDIGVLVGVGVVSGAQPALWIVGITVGLWLWSAPEVGKWRIAGLTALVVGGVFGIAFGLSGFWQDGDAFVGATSGAYILASIAAIVMFFASRPGSVVARSDAFGYPIDGDRVRLGRIAAGSFCVWAGVVAGVAGFWSMGPVFAALVTTAVFRVFVHPA
jgi:hypothetical protein